MRVVRENNEIHYTDCGVRCTFDGNTGRLISIGNKHMKLSSAGLLIDVGCDGIFVLGRLAYHSLDPLRTWELPPIVPQKEEHHKAWGFLGYNDKLQRELHMFYAAGDLELTVIYALKPGGLEVSASIKNMSKERRLLNGVAFILQRELYGDAEFDFPGNVPHHPSRVSELKPYAPVTAGLVNPVIHTESDDGHLNLLFIDEEEKWGTGVYKDECGSIHYVNIASVEAYLDCNESLACGTLYVQLLGLGDRFAPIRELYRSKGWDPPVEGHRDGVLYSCHPNGTMDSGFPERRTMREYAEEIQGLKDMGIDHVWILPIFEHLDRGVYHPTDQKIIDPRYGTDEDVAYFSDKLHAQGMTLMFDYVPHGPELNDPLGIEHREWASVNRAGEPKIEWNCLSFDMANPDYRQYTEEMVKEHVDRFNIDGSRIDCAMGGLSNWKPVRGNRPSSSSLKGGVCISKAIREGILAKNKKPIVTPENFNPVPVYAPYTDIFYDMALYRVLFELENAHVSPAEYASRLTAWLHAELMSTPENYLKLRFLGNHDTVTWVWQKARATAVYGTEKAKALWALFSFIDGIPMIYQGDEDAAICKKEGPVLREFFTELFRARKIWLGNDYNISYLFTGTPIVAFVRICGDRKRLVAVNLSAQQEQCEVDYTMQETLFGQRQQSEAQHIKLEGYGFAIMRL